MDQKPRSINEKILTRRILGASFAQGLGVLASVLLIYFWALSSDKSDDQIRTISFATLMLGNIALILVNRSRHLSIYQTFKQRTNKTIKWVLSGAIGMLALLINVPILREAFHLSSLDGPEWLLVFIAGFGSILWFEIYKVRKNHD